MKPNKLITLVAMLFMMATIAFSAGTPAGTVISNVATGTYDDVNDNPRPPVTSNTVTTTVSHVRGVDLGPDGQIVTLLAGGSITAAKTVTNTGNGTQSPYGDSYDLTVTSITPIIGSGDYTVEIYNDTDGDGVIDAGVDLIITTTPTMYAGDTYDIIVNIIDISTYASSGDQVVVTVKATSTNDAAINDDSDVTVNVVAPVIVMTPTVDNPNPLPSETITYSVCVENTGTADAYNVVLVGPIPTNTTYVPGSIVLVGTGPLTDVGNDDAGDFGITNTGKVTVNLGQVATSGTICVTYQVQINSDAPAGDIDNDPVVSYEDEDGDPPTYPDVTGTVTVTVSPLCGVLIGSDDNITADPGDEVEYTVTVKNTGNQADYINITFTNTSGWAWTIYLDDGDGSRGTGDFELTDSNNDNVDDVGNLSPQQTVTVFVVATVPAGAADGLTNTLVLTGTAVGCGGTTSDIGTYTVNVIAPLLTLLKSVSPTTEQPPGAVLTYAVNVTNAGNGPAKTIVISDVIPQFTTYLVGATGIIADTDGDGTAESDETDTGFSAVYTGGTNTVTFTIPTLASGGSATCTFQVTIN